MRHDAYAGEIRLFAGDYDIRGWMACDGRSLNVADHAALAKAIGNDYGGDGKTSFKLPDLRGRIPVHTQRDPAKVLGLPRRADGEDRVPAVGLRYLICADGADPAGGDEVSTVAYIGEVRPFALDFAPQGWALCHGQVLSIERNTALFSILLTTYGGDGGRTFALPDLRGRAAIGTQGDAGGSLAAGAGGKAFIAINWCIATHEANFPPRA